MAPAALTEKQQQVYNLLTDDKTPQDIAEGLGVSKAAIYSHIRAIKEAGHPVPAKYANVGTGGGRGGKRGTGRSAGKRAPTGTRGRNAGKTPTAVVPPTPTPAPAPTPEPVAASINVDEVFKHLLAQIAEDQQGIEVRRGEIKAEVEALNERLALLGEEDSDLEIALARLAGTAKSIDAAPSTPSADNGKGKGAAGVSLSGAAS